MNPTNNRTLIAIIVLLLITNLLVLGYFLRSNQSFKKERKDGFAAALQKEVGFTDSQIAQFNELKTTNWTLAKAKMDEMKKLKKNFFDLVKNNSATDSVVIFMADSISAMQKQINLNAFRHFKAVRDVCTPNQLSAFDSLMKRMVNKHNKRGFQPSEEK